MRDLANIIAGKTAEIEAAGFFQWTYRRPCRWCDEGYDPVPSSVSDAMVHPDTSIGRVVCTFPQDIFQQQTEEG
jgi:hypothetical protein